jgi:class 3 adenylate cyclase/tetratricopeptide (TPR) repeat protein
MAFECSGCGAKTPRVGEFCMECGCRLRDIHQFANRHSKPEPYTPKFLSDKILSIKSAVEGEHKIVTVFFADVADYMPLSEQLDLEEIHQIMDGCFKILTGEIHKYGGTINQFTGDGVMALFGAPMAHEDHAQRACWAALAVQSAMVGYGKKIQKECGVSFRMRMGLNSGPVIVGAIGDDLRMDYTAIGDTANVSSRMESLANPGSILISKNTYRLVKDFFKVAHLGSVTMKGKTAPQEIFQLLKMGDAATRMDAAIVKGLSRFVGRKNSTRVLLNAFNHAKSGAGQVLGIVGEAGVGKSRLLHEVMNQLPQEDYYSLEGHCLQYGNSMAYHPFLTILRTCFSIQEGDREFLIKKKITQRILNLNETLKDVISPYQELLSVTVDDDHFNGLDPQKKREKTFEAFRDLMIRLSQDKCLVLCVEDLHWIDKTSEEFIDYLIGWLTNSPILLILVYRPEYTHPWGSKSYYTKIGLTQLGRTSSTKLVEALLGEAGVVPELMTLILDRGAGNPLFMEELTRALLENDSIERKEKSDTLRKRALAVHLPDTIQGIIAARMDRLDENLKQTMQVASVVGVDFTFHVLQNIIGMRSELKSDLLHLQNLELIYEKSLFPELKYNFKHALIQEVAYNSLLLQKRKKIHTIIGQAIEEMYADRIEEFYEILAYHYARSDSLKKACLYSRLSGDKAEAKYSHQEAYGFYKDTIDLLSRLPKTRENKQEKMEVFYSMADPVAFLGYPEGALEMIQAFETLAKESGSSKDIARAYSAMALYYSYNGNPKSGMNYSEQAFNEAKKDQDIELIVPLAMDFVVSCQLVGDFYKIIDMAPDIIGMIAENSRESDFFSWGANPYSLLCGYYGFSMGYIGEFNRGKAFLEKGIFNAAKTKDLQTLASIEIHFANLFMIKGEWEQAIAHFKNSIQYCEEVKYSIWNALSWSGLGFACAQLGDTEAGKISVEKGLKLHRDSGVETYLFMPHLYLGRIYFKQGHIEKALGYAEAALRLSQKNNERASEGQSWILLGRILGKTVPLQIEKAEECILKGMEIYHELKTKPNYCLGLLFLGEFYLNTGKKDKAAKNLNRAEEMFQEMGMAYWADRARQVLNRLEEPRIT